MDGKKDYKTEKDTLLYITRIYARMTKKRLGDGGREGDGGGWSVGRGLRQAVAEPPHTEH